MSWLAPSEAYVSYSLLWAYIATENGNYLDIARTNLDYQMRNFPDGRIMTDVQGHGGDVTYRSPERMPYYMMWQVTGSEKNLNYARTFQNASLGYNGWEHAIVDGTRIKLYLHGNAVLDEIQYALVSGDQAALTEGLQLLEALWRLGGSGRDYFQELLAMDLALWTATHDMKYRSDALRVYSQLLTFWDPTPPYGFWAGGDKVTKTCFSRGYPLIDMTPPIIEADPEDQKVSAKIVDPNFKWLNLTYVGISVNCASVYLFYSLDGQNWVGNMQMQAVGGDTYTTLVPQNVAALNPLYLINASDYFNNTSTVQFTKPPTTESIVGASTMPFTVPPVPVTVAPTSSFDFGFAVIALAGIASAASIAVIALVYRRHPMSSAERPGYSVCRCPYWWECYRRHHDCPSCSEMRASGRCCMCIPEGLRPGYCNHPPLDYPYIGQ